MLELLPLVLIYICPFVLIVCGLYFGENICNEVGKQGYITGTSMKSEKIWKYAQQIAPPTMIKVGKISAIVVTVVAVIMCILKYDVDTIVYACNIIGGFFLFSIFFMVDKELEEYEERF